MEEGKISTSSICGSSTGTVVVVVVLLVVLVLVPVWCWTWRRTSCGLKASRSSPGVDRTEISLQNLPPPSRWPAGREGGGQVAVQTSPGFTAACVCVSVPRRQIRTGWRGRRGDSEGRSSAVCSNQSEPETRTETPRGSPAGRTSIQTLFRLSLWHTAFKEERTSPLSAVCHVVCLSHDCRETCDFTSQPAESLRANCCVMVRTAALTAMIQQKYSMWNTEPAT